MTKEQTYEFIGELAIGFVYKEHQNKFDGFKYNLSR